MDDQVECIKEGLKSFCRASSQKINFNKSLIFFSPNILDQVALRLSTNLGVPKITDLVCYLGHLFLHHRATGVLRTFSYRGCTDGYMGGSQSDC